MDNTIDNYQAVLRDLEVRRSRCQAELTEIENLIAGIKRLMGPNASVYVASPAPARMTPPPTLRPLTSPLVLDPLPTVSGRFAGLSVRQAILKLLWEKRGILMSASEIAQALVDGGIDVGKGKDFASNVSAVLSDMKNKRSEVMNTSTGNWSLTVTGTEEAKANQTSDSTLQ